jgi:hypothetical protein
MMKLLCLILLSTLSSVSLAATVEEAMAEPGRLQAVIERDARSRPGNSRQNGPLCAGVRAPLRR